MTILKEARRPKRPPIPWWLRLCQLLLLGTSGVFLWMGWQLRTTSWMLLAAMWGFALGYILMARWIVTHA